MTPDPTLSAVPRGRAIYGALGLAVRAIKHLPGPVRERALDLAATDGLQPPFPDVLRFLEAAKGMPYGTRWQKRLLDDDPALAEVRIGNVGDPNRGVTARLYLPPSAGPSANAAFVWIHGGAFVMGALDQPEAHWPSISLAAAGIAVLSVDYRPCLGGVHYPLPLDDVLQAWRWATEHIDEFEVDVSRLHLGGGSAGGLLSAATALTLRDHDEQMPASLYLGYPVLQPHLPPANSTVAAELATIETVPDEWVQQMIDNWAGAAPQTSPYISPGTADVTGLPPTYVATCGRDVLRRASEPFVDRLREADVPVWGDVFPNSEHAPLDRPGTPDARLALDRLRLWLTGGIAAMQS